MGENKPESLIVDGRRLDGRAFDELRPLKIQTGVIGQADGSAYVELGGTKILVGVYGPRELHPKHMIETDRAIVRCKYDMASFSVYDRKRPGPTRRSIEISKISADALSKVVFLEEFPECVIDVFIEVIQADASTRVTGITAASVAMADAGIPMRDLVTAVSFGKIYDAEGNHYIVLDLFKDEDNYGLADVPLAVIPSTGEITLLQMDGDLTRDEFIQGLNLAMKGVKEIYAQQKEALTRHYFRGDTK